MFKTIRRRRRQLGIGTFCFVLWLSNGLALGATNTKDEEAAGSDQAIPPAVARKLDLLEKRVEELEAELKSQKLPSGPATAVQTAKETTPVEAPPTTALVPQTPGTVQAVQASQPTNQKPEPFSFRRLDLLTGSPRTKTPAIDSKFFTPEIRADTNYVYDFSNPIDDTIGGSSEIFRSSEFHVTQLGVGGDFHYNDVRARVMTQLGMYSQTQPRNDASSARGQWLTLTPGIVDNGYRYISEAYGGYHFNKLNGINVDAGIFLSYIGLFSFYNFDNWAYQPSFVSSNTPWFFNGLRLQIFPTEKLKIEPWLINGWQSYGRFNHRPGIGGADLVAS
jgi:hypothetical protein